MLASQQSLSAIYYIDTITCKSAISFYLRSLHKPETFHIANLNCVNNNVPIYTCFGVKLLQCVMFSTFIKCKLHSVMSERVELFLVVLLRKSLKLAFFISYITTICRKLNTWLTLYPNSHKFVTFHVWKMHKPTKVRRHACLEILIAIICHNRHIILNTCKWARLQSAHYL